MRHTHEKKKKSNLIKKNSLYLGSKDSAKIQTRFVKNTTNKIDQCWTFFYCIFPVFEKDLILVHRDQKLNVKTYNF